VETNSWVKIVFGWSKLERSKLYNQILNLYQKEIFRVIVHKALGEKVFSFLAINIRKKRQTCKTIFAQREVVPALLLLNIGHGKITQPLLLWWLSSHCFFRNYCDQLDLFFPWLLWPVIFALEVKKTCYFWSLFLPVLRSIHKYAHELLKSVDAKKLRMIFRMTCYYSVLIWWWLPQEN